MEARASVRWLRTEVESLHCSAAYVHRLGFALAKILCPLFGIPTVPGRHILPLWTTVKVITLCNIVPE
jgi:hypothetical protein